MLGGVREPGVVHGALVRFAASASHAVLGEVPAMAHIHAVAGPLHVADLALGRIVVRAPVRRDARRAGEELAALHVGPDRVGPVHAEVRVAVVVVVDGHKAAVIVLGVAQNGGCDLTLVRKTGGLAGLGSCLGEDREEDRGQNSDDRDDHKQLD